MGLDQYLEKCDRKMWGYRDLYLPEVKTNKPELYEELKPYIIQRGGEYFHWESLFEEVGYWRKANAIHKWFVDNVQNGEDNCNIYEVSRDQLEELLKICKRVKKHSKLVPGSINNGYQSNGNGGVEPIIEDGMCIEDPTYAAKYLPTQCGFFFGSTDYDEWYMNDIDYTIKTLDKVLKETDFDTQMIAYQSSW